LIISAWALYFNAAEWPCRHKKITDTKKPEKLMGSRSGFCAIAWALSYPERWRCIICVVSPV
jgi:hypothetical protein